MNRRSFFCGCRAPLALLCLSACGATGAITYEVGPGKPFSAIGQVPWESLQPGDTVLICWRAEPYREKWVICCQGKAGAPITVRGMPGTHGQLPVIDGDGATPRAQLDYWGGFRSVIKIGGARHPHDTTPQYVVIESLEIRNSRPPFRFKDADGKAQPYHPNAAAIHVEKGEHVTIRNCILHDCGNGLFVSSNDQQASRDILIEGNYIYGNGNPRSGTEHNVYTEAIGITFQFNRFGPLRAGCEGNNLKDRSAGLVVRCNWIEGGNQELDLVEGEDSALVRNDIRYRTTFVYGNIIIEPKGAGHPFIVHYGGDSARRAIYRKGVLHFYNNTVVSLRPDSTVLLRVSSDAESCDCRNNIVCVPESPGAELVLVENLGIVALSHNWLSRGWQRTPGLRASANVYDDGTSISGDSPGFVDLTMQDYHLVPASPCRDRGAASDAEPFRSHPVDRQYVKHQSGESRPADGAIDIGAFEVATPSGKMRPSNLR